MKFASMLCVLVEERCVLVRRFLEGGGGGEEEEEEGDSSGAGTPLFFFAWPAFFFCDAF